MANFNYLEEIPEFKNFASICIEAEKRWRTDTPVSCVKEIRTALEMAIRWVYHTDIKLISENISQNNLYDLMSNKKFSCIIGTKLTNELHYIRKKGNIATHENGINIDKNVANTCMKYLFNFIQWMEATYCKKHYKKRSFKESGMTDTVLDNLTLKNIGLIAGGVLGGVATIALKNLIFSSKNKA